jgi:hypothetical protein
MRQVRGGRDSIARDLQKDHYSRGENDPKKANAHLLLGRFI